MKPTKEQLIVELAKLRQSHEEWVSGDERKRKEFAKAFNWYKDKVYYDGQYGRGELLLPSWEQIFTQVGKLLAAKNFYDFEGNISELECKLENIEERIKKNINPNF